MLLVGVSQHTPGEEWAWYLKEPAEKKSLKQFKQVGHDFFLGGKGIHQMNYHILKEKALTDWLNHVTIILFSSLCHALMACKSIR